jgi:hypothetical protein
VIEFDEETFGAVEMIAKDYEDDGSRGLVVPC